MSVATIITILSIINGLLSVAKDAPAVIAEAKTLLAKIEPHVSAAEDSVKSAFADTHAKLASGSFDFDTPAPAGQDQPDVVA